MQSLQYEINEKDFWRNPRRAREISQRYDSIKEELERWDHIENEARELVQLLQMTQEEGDEQMAAELKKKAQELADRFSQLEFFVLLSEKYDRKNAIVSIHAGAGGVDAQDWSEMVLRMLLRYCERKGLQTTIIDETRGGEGGIKSVTFQAQGAYAYGLLKSEAGVHRLVRISPFDAEQMRHTSFTLVEVIPDIGEEIEEDIREEDLRIEFFRSSGHGGQSVNTTDSAVRITHIPTGITVKCQNERSQHQNREMAMKYLKAKLVHMLEMKQKKEIQELKGEVPSAEWGNQIRSYILHPYTLVKDHRTGYEEQNAQKVLGGEIEHFVESYLRFNYSRRREGG